MNYSKSLWQLWPGTYELNIYISYKYFMAATNTQGFIKIQEEFFVDLTCNQYYISTPTEIKIVADDI